MQYYHHKVKTIKIILDKPGGKRNNSELFPFLCGLSGGCNIWFVDCSRSSFTQQQSKGLTTFFIIFDTQTLLGP